MTSITYLSKNGISGHGPNNSNPMVHINKPTTIIDQWLLTLSANHPQAGLDRPYNPENSKNISPIFSALRLN